MNSLKKSFLSGLVFSGTVLCSFLVYAATIVTVSNQPVSSGDVIGASWFQDVNNRLVSLSGSTSVPSGAIMAFYLSNCPTGWIVADGTNSTPNLRGEFIRGWDFNNSGVDNGRNLGSSQADSFKSHSHTFNRYEGDDNTGGSSGAQGGDAWSANIITNGFTTNITGGTETRPRNVALLYCMKL